MRVLIVEIGAMEESSIDSLFMYEDHAIACVKKLAEAQSDKMKSFYKDKQFTEQWKVTELKPHGNLRFGLRIGKNKTITARWYTVSDYFVEGRGEKS